MGEWKEYKLGDVSKFLNGRAYKATEFRNEGTPIVRIQNLTGVGNQVYSDLRLPEDKYIDKGDLVYAWSATFGPFIWKGQKSIYHYHIWKIICNEKLINKYFLYYHLLNKSDGLKDSGNGTLFTHITKELMESFVLKLPPIPEQLSITRILRNLDDKIDLLHRQNKTLEALAETLFRQWFVEEAEESWEVEKLGDVINIFDSKRIPLSSMERDKMKFGNLYPYYGAATIMDYINDYLFDGEYILMGEDGTVETEDGYPVLQMPTGKFWVNNHAHIFTARPPYSNYFIYTFLKITSISNIVTGAVQPKINQEMLKSISFPIPDEVKTKNYVSITNYYWGKMKANNNQIRTLTQLRDTLLPKLMSGEMRVKN